MRGEGVNETCCLTVKGLFGSVLGTDILGVEVTEGIARVGMKMTTDDGKTGCLAAIEFNHVAVEDACSGQYVVVKISYDSPKTVPRPRFGLDADLDPEELAIASLTNDQNVCAKMSPYLFSIKRKEQGVLKTVGTGFYPVRDSHAAITAARVTPMGTEENLYFFSPDGTRWQGLCAFAHETLDVSIVKVSRACPLPSLRYRTASVGDQVYVLGFSGSSSNLNFTKGMVSSLHQGGFTINADHGFSDGFSGGPVFSIHMELLGMVRDAQGHQQQVSCVNADSVWGIHRAVSSLKPEVGMGM